MILGWTAVTDRLYRRASPVRCFTPRHDARVAQLVEHATENRSVGGSKPPPGTTLFSPSEFLLPFPRNLPAFAGSHS